MKHRMGNHHQKVAGILFSVVFSIASVTGQPRTVTILHTNDIHAGFVPHEAFWSNQSPKPKIGGFSELGFMVDSIRTALSGALVLDAGDVMTGNPVTEYEYNGAQGGALFEMMSRIGYDAWCPGNHDFDISQSNFIGLTNIARFPTLCANLVNEKNEFPVNNRPWVIIEKNGVKIGIIGIISQVLYNLVNQHNLTGLKVLAPVTTTQKLIDELAPRVDLVIAITHQGVDDDSALAENVHGLHAIIGGHSHTRLTKPKIVNGVIIAQAGSNCEYLGELQITLEDHRVTGYKGTLHPLWSRNDRRQTPLTAMIDSVNGVIDSDYSEVIAQMESGWSEKGSGTALGDLITEAQRDAAHAQIAFMNLHGIRRSIGAGPLTKRGLFEVLPFRNVLTVFTLTGKEIRSIMNYHLDKKSAILTAGLVCNWRKTQAGAEIILLEVDGTPVNDTSTYICAASDYVVGEAQRYLGIDLTNVTFLNQTVFDAVETKLRALKVVAPDVRKRIIKVD